MYWYFASWAEDGTLDRLHDILGLRVRRAKGRLDAPTAGIVDAQSVRGADTVPAVSRGYDAGKRVNGRNRHIIVDTFGLLLVVLVTAAAVQDRDGSRRAMLICRQAHPTIRLVGADGGYAGKLAAWARTVLDVIVSVVTKPAGRRGATPPLGGRANLRLDHQLPPAGRRLQTHHLPLRSHDQAGDGGADDPPARPPSRRS